MEFPQSFLRKKDTPVVGVLWHQAQGGLYWGGEEPTPTQAQLPSRPTSAAAAPETAAAAAVDLGKLGFSEVRLPSAQSRRAKNGASNNNNSSSSAKKAPKDEEAARADKRARVLKKFEDEIDMPSNLDFGSKAPSRAQLRSLVQEVVLAGAKISKRSYSHSHLSSQNSSRGVGEELGDDAIARLKALQKERLIVVRMGFVERANQLDAEIAEWRAKAAKAKAEGEAALLETNLRQLEGRIGTKRDNLLAELKVEEEALEEVLSKEFTKMRLQQRQEFMRIVENCERRAMGKVKKCNCGSPFLCKHNKTASYNVRKPIKDVLNFRQNSKRLKKGGRIEDSQMWEEKANDIDYKEAEKFRTRVAKSIITSPWGANEAQIDKLIEKHKKESSLVQKTQKVRREVLKEKQDRRLFAFENLAVAEKQRVRLASKKEFERRCLERAARAVEDEKAGSDDGGDIDGDGGGGNFTYDWDDPPTTNQVATPLAQRTSGSASSSPESTARTISPRGQSRAGGENDGEGEADEDAALLCMPCDEPPITELPEYYRDIAPEPSAPNSASADAYPRLQRQQGDRPSRAQPPQRGGRAQFDFEAEEAGEVDDDDEAGGGFDLDALMDGDDDEALEAAAAEAEAFLRKNGGVSFSSVVSAPDVDLDQDVGDGEDEPEAYGLAPSPPKQRPAGSSSASGGGYAGRAGVRFVAEGAGRR